MGRKNGRSVSTDECRKERSQQTTNTKECGKREVNGGGEKSKRRRRGRGCGGVFINLTGGKSRVVKVDLGMSPALIPEKAWTTEC